MPDTRTFKNPPAMVNTFTAMHENPAHAAAHATEAADTWLDGRAAFCISSTMTLVPDTAEPDRPWYLFTLTIALVSQR